MPHGETYLDFANNRIQSPNKAPEPTAVAVIPPAMSPFTEMDLRIRKRSEARVTPATGVAWLIVDVCQMKPLVLGLSVLVFAGCAKERAAVPAIPTRATKEERTLEARVRSVDAFVAKNGEPEPAEVISAVLTQRALKEFLARVPSATRRVAEIRFVGGSLAIVTLTYTLEGANIRREQEIQFIHTNREWTMFWIPTPQKPKG